MNDVLLLGAGFSKAVSSSMPLLDDLNNELKSKVPNVPGDNIEHWMTFLSQPHPWLSESENLKNRALFLELTQAIRDTLLDKTETTMKVCPECPTWLDKLVRQCSEHKANVITLNYDTLIESAAQSVSSVNFLDYIYPIPLTPAHRRRMAMIIPAGHGGVQLAFKLLKMHGSVNWFYSGASDYTGETIYYINVEKWQNYSKTKTNYENQTIEYLSDKVPLIVPPLLEKVSFLQHETIRTIWRLAGQALRSAERLICIGYSLPETDLSFRFFLETNAPKGRIPLYIINPDIKSYAYYKKLLGTSYDVNDKYTGRVIDEQLISELFS